MTTTRLLGGLRPRTLAALDCFLILGVLGLYLKLSLLSQEWDAVARFLTRPGAEALTSREQLGFFFNDIAVNILLVPVIATAAVSALRPRYRLAAALGASVALSLFYFADLRAQSEVGRYISGFALPDLLGWAWSNPSASTEYVTPASVVKLTALLFAFVAIATIAHRAEAAERRPAGRAHGYRWLLFLPAVLVFGGGLLLAPVSYAARQHDSPLNATAVGRAFATLFDDEDRPEELAAVERALEATRLPAGAPPVDRGPAFAGSERGADVLVFMMETGPAQALDLASVGRALPGTGPLFDRAFVARQHYTTHPYSSDAMYSILSGLYPQGRRRLLRQTGNRSLNALMTALEPEAALRAVYLPSLYRIELDERMYTAFGAQSVYVSDRRVADPLRIVAQRRADALIADLEQHGSHFDQQIRERLAVRLVADFQALEKLKADITAAVRANERYCVMFFPEIGHAPWFQLHQEASVVERGRTLMLLQDSWLKEIVDLVRSLGRLDETVIAVTADHGIRTRAEDPSLPLGKISEYMFRVPLLVYAPRTLQQTHVITVPSSHIDFAPTLLALLGKADRAEPMQGVPVWQRRPSDRLYFFASTYGGANGFTQDGAFYMHQALSEIVYRSNTFSFSNEQIVTPGDPAMRFVTDALTQANRVQQAVVSRVAAAQ